MAPMVESTSGEDVFHASRENSSPRSCRGTSAEGSPPAVRLPALAPQSARRSGDRQGVPSLLDEGRALELRNESLRVENSRLLKIREKLREFHKEDRWFAVNCESPRAKRVEDAQEGGYKSKNESDRLRTRVKELQEDQISLAAQAQRARSAVERYKEDIRLLQQQLECRAATEVCMRSARAGILDKVLIKWDAESANLELCECVRAWLSVVHRGGLAILRAQVARSPQLRSILNKMLLRFGSKFDDVLLQDILNVWREAVRASKKEFDNCRDWRLRSPRQDLVLDKALSVMSREADMLLLHGIACAWSSATIRQRLAALETKAGKCGKIDHALSMSLKSWDLDVASTELRETFRSWRGVAKSSKLDCRQVELLESRLAKSVAALETKAGKCGRLDHALSISLKSWDLDVASTELRETFRSWRGVAKSSKLDCRQVELLESRLAKSAKLDTTLNKAVSRWGSDIRDVEVHELIRVWHTWTSRRRNVYIKRRVVARMGSEIRNVEAREHLWAWHGIVAKRKAHRGLDGVLDKAVMRWASDIGTVELFECIRAWHEHTSLRRLEDGVERTYQKMLGDIANFSKERRARDKKFNALLGKSLLRWGSDMQAVVHLEVLHAWQHAICRDKAAPSLDRLAEPQSLGGKRENSAGPSSVCVLL